MYEPSPCFTRKDASSVCVGESSPAQTHTLEAAGQFAEPPEFMFQKFVVNKRRNPGHSDPCGGSGQRGHLHQQVPDEHAALHQALDERLLCQEHNHCFVHSGRVRQFVVSHLFPDRQQHFLHHHVVIRRDDPRSLPETRRRRLGGRHSSQHTD
ncbi:hypothetical protein F2P81_006199 [Scophthalmus maximus]|uniref:Uncharacterized protein n=1 Tax=Scophthalmus maximus TaxID=52904 RepID=A0A6A4T8J4_SCOMX|nr:hypothetical protein F2P81_006199 [Scophthalmus maximus]